MPSNNPTAELLLISIYFSILLNFATSKIDYFNFNNGLVLLAFLEYFLFYDGN